MYHPQHKIFFKYIAGI